MRHAARRALADDLDDARHRVAAEERRLRAADHFDTLHEVRGQVAEIERAARLVQGNAVEQHLVVAALAAAHEERRHIAEAARSHDRDARRRAQELADERHIAPLYFFTREDGDCRADLARRRFSSRGRHHHRFLHGCDVEREHDWFVVGNRCARRIESRKRHDSCAAVARPAEMEHAARVGERRRDLAVARIDQAHGHACERATALVGYGS